MKKLIILLFITHGCLSMNYNDLTTKEKITLYLQTTGNAALTAGSISLGVYTLFQIGVQDPLITYGFLLFSAKGIWDHTKPTYNNVKQLWTGKSKKFSPEQINKILTQAAKDAVDEAVSKSTLDVSITPENIDETAKSTGGTTVPATIYIKPKAQQHSREDNFTYYLQQGNEALKNNEKTS